MSYYMYQQPFMPEPPKEISKTPYVVIGIIFVFLIILTFALVFIMKNSNSGLFGEYTKPTLANSVNLTGETRKMTEEEIVIWKARIQAAIDARKAASA